MDRKNLETKVEINPRLLRGDLDNIILMALRKEPDRRYASVEDFSNDIDKYLNALPINARPNTFFYRASKFYSRNRTASIVGLFLVLSLVTGIIATTWQAYVARQERDRAQKRFMEVRKLSNSLLFEITPKIENLEGSTEAREVVVRRALEYLDSLTSESQDDLTLQSELASAYEKVGDVQGNPDKPNLGDLQGGIQSYQKAQIIRLLLAAKVPDDFETNKLLAKNYNSIGDFRWWASDISGATADYEKAIGTFEKLLQLKPDDLQLQLDLLNSINNRIKVISYNGNYVESLKMYHEVLKQLEILETRFSAQPQFERIKAYTLMRIAYDLSWQNHFDILGDYLKKSLTIYEPLVTANPNDAKLRRDLYFAYFQAGGIYVEINPPLSSKFLKKSIEIAKRTAEIDKINYQAKFDVAQSYSKLGELSSIQKKYGEAIDYLSKAETILTELTLAEPKHDGYKYTLANNYARLGAAQEGNHEPLKAIENYQKAITEHLELRQKSEQDNMPVRAIAIAAQDIGRIYEEQQNKVQALNYYKQSVEMFVLLEQKGGLGEYDKKNFELSNKAVQRMEKK
jgi:tetratricopeptide (TPR) repeat protein